MSWYLGICAAAVFFGATLLLVQRARLSLFGARTTGEVVAYTTRMSARRGRADQMPHVRFVGPDMRSHELVSSMSANPARWPIGTTVPVAFLSHDPARAEIATWARLWAAPTAMLLFAAGLAFAALTAAA